MSRVPWHLFKDRQPRAHLVAAVLRAAPTSADPSPREAKGILVRLVRAQRPASYYATTVVREAGRPEVHLAFEDKGDARNLASLVAAEPTGSYPGWASQQAFQLEGAKLSALAASLPAPKAHRKEPPGDDSLLGRLVRFGLSRAPRNRVD
jgi:hypothetical protein